MVKSVMTKTSTSWVMSVLGRMVEEAWFGRYVILERNGTPGHVAVVLDGQGRRL